MAADSSPWSRRRFLGAGAAVSAGLALGACSLDRASSPDTSAEREPTGNWSGDLIDPAWDKPEVTFTDLDGQPFPFAEKTAGTLSLLFFGFTSCPDVCPVFLNTLARAREAVGTGPGSRPNVYFVGVDIERDTPEVMKEYLGNIDPTFHGLTGTEDVINAALKGVFAPPVEIGAKQADGSYDVGHAAYATVYLADDDKGHRRYPSNLRQQDWARDLPRLAKGAFA